VTIVVTGVARWENQRKIPIGLQKDCRWRNVIAILVIAVEKTPAAEITERQVLGGPYSLLRSQFDWHDGAPLALLCHLRSGAFLRKLSSMPNSRRLWMTYSSPMISRTHPRTTGRVGRGSSEPSPRSICRKVNATAVRTT
jgi:hypothetical protein